MKFYILTLFPEMMENVLNTSILGRAKEGGYISFEAVNIRDYTKDKHKKVDDYPYGGGAGMVMQAQPIYDAYMHVCQLAGHKVKCLYLTPQGKLFDQPAAKSLALEEDLCLLCGHYEGVDERVLEEIVDGYYSIGDYVLTGGELPALVMIDAISRMVPGVLTNSQSGSDESLEGNLLEYPQYSRPETWNDRTVPAILLSGDHARVDKWRFDQRVERTKAFRPDLYEKYLSQSQNNG
ncbi:MAG: tRNA (guanosine(37)-N1)-methyltransferase TrmD [Pseudobutyrivibrio sp.]|nr:tRNA (guanosine(37)-N1)-methyltransferase TrmD [Pseudobutyrivibrio sp.]